MNQPHTMTIANELKVLPNQVDATVGLLQGGASVPFIARYRKEATGSLDETLIVQIRDRLVQLEALEKRRETILDALLEQGKLTEELRRQIAGAETLAKLEDLYLPFRPKRRTRAGIAREKGLEPLARMLLHQKPETRPAAEAEAFLDGEKGVRCGEDALAGARDIIAEWVSENIEIRASLRDLFMHKGILKSNVIKGKEAEAVQYRDYYEWEESVKSAPSHRILATRRGEREGFLNVRMVVNVEEALAVIDSACLTGNGEASQQVREAGRDGYKRLLAPSMENELKQWAKERADKEAIRVFADNLRHLLMAPPLGSKRLMAIDPGFRTGCKVVCLDGQGKLLQSDTVYPHSGKQSAATAAKRLMALVNEYQVQAIAVGNGTAGRKTESFVRALPLPENVQVIMTDESGASVYSASQLAREEFPDEDVTVRGAISIGRRLMDPLAELVKIDPKSIGVGQYQHDVDQKQLKQSLDDVVMSCVNAVGVEVNTASAQLLAYVSGLGPQLARNLIGCRDEKGPFRSRRELKKVPRLGAKVFEQAAGFLRIRGGDNPLDASAVHPESYGIVEAMAKDLGCGLADMIGNETLCRQIDLSRYVDRDVGLPTLKDIQAELAKPGRDPRDSFEPFAFADGVQSMEDLVPGMKLPGIVTNVTVFGAFVDIGVHRDGLVHLSELTDRFVKDPREVVHVHQQVMVTVLEVDLERKRISLSMKKSAHEAPKTQQPKSSKGHPKGAKGRHSSSGTKSGFNNPFAQLLKN